MCFLECTSYHYILRFLIFICLIEYKKEMKQASLTRECHRGLSKSTNAHSQRNDAGLPYEGVPKKDRR